MFLLCFYLIIEQWTHLTREFEQRIYTIHFSCNLVNFGGSKNHFHRKEMWNLKIHTIIHMRSVYILYSNEICECALWSHGGEKTLKLSAQFFLKKYSKTKTGSFKTQICPKVVTYLTFLKLTSKSKRHSWQIPKHQHSVEQDLLGHHHLVVTLGFRTNTLVPFWSLRETFQIQRKMEKKEDLEATQRATVFCLLPQLPNEWFFDLKVMLAWWERIKILK